MCGDECVRVLPDEQNYQEEPPRDKLVFEVYGALLPPKLKTLQEPLHDLTRIRRKLSSNPDGAYVSAMHWKELTTSSGPFSAKKLS